MLSLVIIVFFLSYGKNSNSKTRFPPIGWPKAPTAKLTPTFSRSNRAVRLGWDTVTCRNDYDDKAIFILFFFRERFGFRFFFFFYGKNLVFARYTPPWWSVTRREFIGTATKRIGFQWCGTRRGKGEKRPTRRIVVWNAVNPVRPKVPWLAGGPPVTALQIAA